MTHALSSVPGSRQFIETHDAATTHFSPQKSDAHMSQANAMESVDLISLMESALAHQPTLASNDNTPHALSRQRRNAAKEESTTAATTTHEDTTANAPAQQPQAATMAKPSQQSDFGEVDSNEADPNNVPVLISLVRATRPFQKLLNEWKNDKSQSHAEEWALITNYDKTQPPSKAVTDAMVKGVQTIVSRWRADGTFSDYVQKCIEFGKNRLNFYLELAKKELNFKPSAEILEAQKLGPDGMARLWEKAFKEDWENTEAPNLVLYTYEIIERTSRGHGTASAPVKQPS